MKTRLPSLLNKNRKIKISKLRQPKERATKSLTNFCILGSNLQKLTPNFIIPSFIIVNTRNSPLILPFRSSSFSLQLDRLIDSLFVGQGEEGKLSFSFSKTETKSKKKK